MKLLFVLFAFFLIQFSFAQQASGGRLELQINFESKKAEIPFGDTAVVAEVARMLRADPKMRISIEGHTDNGGDPQRNFALSLQRAIAVKDRLVTAGIAADRLSVKGWGSEHPLTDNNTEDAKARNRRVEILIQ